MLSWWFQEEWFADDLICVKFNHGENTRLDFHNLPVHSAFGVERGNPKEPLLLLPRFLGFDY